MATAITGVEDTITGGVVAITMGTAIGDASPILVILDEAAYGRLFLLRAAWRMSLLPQQLFLGDNPERYS